MSKKVITYKDIGTVIYNKNKRSRSIKIKVKPDCSLSVSLPFYYSFKQAEKVLLKNKKWIADKLQEMENRQPVFADKTIIHTKLHKVFIKIDVENDVKSDGNDVYIRAKELTSEKTTQWISNIITEIYRFEAKKILPERLRTLANQQGFSYNRVSIRNNKTNWGSCSSKNNISLNLQMMKLPDHLIDYILLHELIHTEIKNHSAAFWQKLDEVTNFRAKELSKAVKKYSTYTLL